jgi:ribosomal subunit interface protein
MANRTGESKRSRIATRKTMRSARKAALPPPGVTVTFRHVEPTVALRAYAERKFAHVGRYLTRACEVHLILSVDKYRQHGEVLVKAGHLAVTAQKESKDLYAVIDLLADKVGRQLRSHLAKSKTKKVRTKSTGELLSAAEERVFKPGLGRA